MASLPTRTTASFDAIKPVSSLVLLDNEFNQYVGAAGIFNGGTTGTKLLVKASDATDPPIAVDQIGAGLILQGKQNGVEKFRVENDGDIVGNGITGAAGVYTFGSIPIGPASNPTTDDQLARKKYVDDSSVAFSVCWSDADPSTSTTGQEDRPIFLVPDGSGMVITKWRARYAAGSHTSGGSITFTLRYRSVGGSVSDIATISLNDTNNATNTNYTASFSQALSAGDCLTYFVASRSGTVSERSVALGALGTQKRI
jgi:hypothetical protein